MPSFFSRILLGHCVLLASLVSAQQFAATSIVNTLPAVPTSEVAYWNIPGANNISTTLINYSSLTAAGTRLDANVVERAVIIVHGLQRDPWNYMSEGISALQAVVAEEGGAPVNFNTVQLAAPYFPDGNDKTLAYPWNASAPAGGKGSTSPCLVWYGSNWINGANNQYPYKTPTISSYAVLDTMIQYYANKTLYPNMKQIVVAGHSAGAQTVQRYAAVGNLLNVTVPISYWVANPDSLLWFSASRPLDTTDCSTFDVWREGLSNYTNTYGAALVAQGRSAVLARYDSRQIAYARGTLDEGDDASTCAAYTTGNNRNERFFEFIKAFPVSCTSGACSTIDYVPVGHDAGQMMNSTAGQARLFFDNFSGNGKLAYDYGCPRLQTGDDPYADPTCKLPVAAPLDQNITLDSYKYVGCYTDAEFYPTLSYTAYLQNPNSTTNATVQTCLSACAAANYTLAGMEYGEQCFCGNSMYWDTFGPLPNESCLMPCAGNSSQICGDANRLSVFSKSGTAAVIDATPSAPATVNGFVFEGCYTELASGGRSLSGPSLTSNSMTLELCTKYCQTQGYAIAGTEYASQCYCGNTLPTGANYTYTPECSYPCNGNATQFCGGSGLLSVYANATLWGTNFTTSATTSTSSTTTLSTSNSLTSSAPLVTATSALSCPSSNGLAYVTNGDVFEIECYLDHPGYDLTMSYTSTLEGCATACATTTGCVDVSWVPGTSATSPCYMKSALNTGSSATNVWGARLVGRASNSTTTSTSSVSNSTVTSFSSSTTAPVTSTTSLSTTSSITSSTSKPANSTTSLSSTSASISSSVSLNSTTLAKSSSKLTSTSSHSSTASSTSKKTSSTSTKAASVASSTSKSSSLASSISSSASKNGTSTSTSQSSSSTIATTASSSTSSSVTTSSTTTSSPNSSSTATSSTTTSSPSSSSTTTISTITSSHSSSSTATSSTASSKSSTTSSRKSTTSSKSSTSSPKTSTTSSTSPSRTASSSTATSSTSISSATPSSTTTSSTSTSSTSTSSSSAISSSTSKSSTSSSSTSSSSTASSSTTSSTTPSDTTTTTSSTATSTATALPSGFSALGCFQDNTTSPALAVEAYANASNTPSLCATTCRERGFEYSGTENGNQCWCGDTLPAQAASNASCSAACPGAKTQLCGAKSLLSVVRDLDWAGLTIRQSYGNWAFQGCYSDTSAHKTLPTVVAGLGGAANMTIPNCLSACQSANLTYCGAENYGKCYGATKAPSATLQTVPTASPIAAGCNVPCYGNGSEICGGVSQLVVYFL